MDTTNGVINIYKEKGYTSFDVVAIVRKTLGRVKTGHTGTLDPEAEGVLPICVGKATKISDYLMADKKCYIAELNLGFTTDTYDFTGKVITRKDVNSSKAEIEKAIMSFIGCISQVPPMYSAIKVDGKRLYELARQGEVIERKPREVTVFDIKILEFMAMDKVLMEVHCSKGTYIRSLCFDIGETLGCGANMGKLIRTQSGQFLVGNAIKLEHFKELVEDGRLGEILIPIDKALSFFRTVQVREEGEKLLRNGNKINIDLLNGFYADEELKPNETFIVLDYMGNIVGLHSIEGEFLRPVTMLT